MTIDKFITNLRKEKNIIVSVDGTELLIKGSKQHLTSEIIEDIKLRKHEILMFFSNQLQKRHYTEIKPSELKKYYKLSSTQQRLYFLWEFDKQSIAYNMPQVLELKGPLNKDRLTNVFSKLIDRHESLRTSFITINAEIVQIISSKVSLEISCLKADEKEIESIIKSFIKPFDLSYSSLLRVGLIEISERSHILLLDMHHIISDGFSEGILIKDFMTLYNGEEIITPILQYRDYIKWQQSKKHKILIEKQKSFWLKEFSEDAEELDLPTDFLRPDVKSFAGNKVDFEISKEDTIQLNSLANEKGASLFMILLSAFNILLSKLSNRDDIIIGTPTSGRYHADIEHVMGMFVNTIVLRNQVNCNLTFPEFLEKVKTNTLFAFENQDYQYEDLVSSLKIERNTSRNPLFDVVFVLQNTEKVSFEIPQLNLKLLENPQHIVSKFDLTLVAYESRENLYFSFEYSTDLFKKETIENFVSYFKRIISSIITESTMKISDIEIISDNEKLQILNEFNNTKTVYPNDKNIIEIFDDQVKKMPKAIALVYEGTELNYESLSKRSSQLARHLIKKGVTANSCVGILVDRSLEMIVGILGILKAGAAYVPIDINYPKERINYIIVDCNLNALLTVTAFKERSPFVGLTVFLDDARIYNSVPVKLVDLPKGNDVAYIMYTSGSTGNPKGVLVKHKSVIRLVKNSTIIKYSEKERFMQTGNPVFDATTFEIWGSLLNGSSLYMVKDDVIIDSLKLKDFLYENKNISIVVNGIVI